MTQKTLTILGATGSIGRSALEVVRMHADDWRVGTLAGGSRVAPLVEAALETNPDRVVIADEGKYQELRRQLDAVGLGHVEAAAGADAVADAAAEEADAVLQSIVGAAGVEPTFRAVEAGRRLLLANKESVVCGGGLLMGRARATGALMLPVDSEHNALFQCLAGADEAQKAKARLILTASGGPFRGRKDLTGITPEEAVRHPNWSMGRKISVDSATLMNKGLEVIEASWLFGFPGDRIDVVVHPESIVHSMVEFADGCVLAQMGTPSMKNPIAYAMAWPERIEAGVERLNLAKIGRLTFEAPDTETFPLLKLAYEALAGEGGETIVLNAANEIAVEAFLAKRIAFTTIFSTVAGALESIPAPKPASVDDILALDREVRRRVRAALGIKEGA